MRRRCPCCGESIFLCPLRSEGSAWKSDYKSFYCPKCKSRIFGYFSAAAEFWIGIGLFVLLWSLVSFLIETLYGSFGASSLVAMVFAGFVLVILSCLAALFMPLGCYGVEPQEGANEEHIIEKGYIELDSSRRITPFEKKMMRWTLWAPWLYFLFVVLGVIVTMIWGFLR
ncbi:MAG: hypothetical protein C6H99_02100 [Epsilonproteobacteria bacterium]|nr:hypothetical protein [Campylobacterota bacterium]NPA63875.1 hypothetical protein [Campylobacterota bacterium]